MCNNIINEKKKGTYDGAYKAVKIAAGISEGRFPEKRQDHSPGRGNA